MNIGWNITPLDSSLDVIITEDDLSPIVDVSVLESEYWAGEVVGVWIFVIVVIGGISLLVLSVAVVGVVIAAWFDDVETLFVEVPSAPIKYEEFLLYILLKI